MNNETNYPIYIIGDEIEDLILISRQKKKNMNYSINYDLFTRDVISSYRTKSGVSVLTELLTSYYTDEESIEILANNKENITSSTISEWKEVKEKNDITHLYLEKHIGLIENSNTKFQIETNELDKLQTAKTVVIYDMSSRRYTTNNKEINLWEYIKAENIIVRTKFDEGQKCTKLIDDLSNSTNNSNDIQNKCILLFNVNELRRGGFNIRKGISWEQLVYETTLAIQNIKNHDKYKAIIVCFNHEGCLLFQKDSVNLICYRDEIEGDFVIKKSKRAFGPILTMQAAITIGQLKNEEVSVTIKNGLILMRDLISHGFDKDATYPYKYIVEKLKENNFQQNEKMLSRIIKISSLDSNINFINDIYDTTKKSKKSDVFEKCKTIIKNGPTDIDAPYLRLQDLLTFDRTEIEQLRSIYELFKLYIKDQSISKPFSICVFGQPGSGKSFAVKQIAKSLKISDKAILEFNLSQMSSPQELFSAFHQIRDAGLKGEVPVAFFDEFDSDLNGELGWLKYFLAPMQDGEFRENAIPHFLGRAIFVFAGGTCHNTQQFKDMQNNKNAKGAKLPDFLSRIKGYIDITGPNPLPCPEYSNKKPVGCWSKSIQLNEKKENQITPISKGDKAFITNCTYRNTCCLDDSHYLRRATLLRSMLERKLNKSDGDIIDIDDNVLNAFLKVSNYLHGARSLEAIIQMSEIPSTQQFTATCIYKNYLDLYVSDDFEEYLNQH